jgi:hypothetical protein
MAFRLPPTPARRVGFELAAPRDVELSPSGDVVRCRERQAGRTIGELEISVFHAALVIDRDGILEDKVRAAVEAAIAAGANVLEPVPVELPGASGFRADAEYHRGTELPHEHVFAIAPDDLGVDAGVLVTVRSASAEWPAADAILASLKILSRGKPSANDASPLRLPVVGKNDD